MGSRRTLSNLLDILLRPTRKAIEDAANTASENVCRTLPDFDIPESGIKSVVVGVLEQARELERRVGVAEADSKRLQALSKRISDAFVCVSSMGEILDFNTAFSRLFEITMEEVRGTPEGLVRAAALISTIRTSSVPGAYTMNNRFSMETVPGVTRLLEVARVSVENSRGQEQVFILRDVTVEQEWCERLSQSEKTLSAVSQASQIISESPLEVAVPKVMALLSEAFKAEHSLLVHIENQESAIVLGGTSPSDRLISEVVQQTTEPNGISQMRRKQDFLTRTFEDCQLYTFPLRVNKKFWGVFSILSKPHEPLNLNDLSINAILTFIGIIEGVLEKDLLGRAWDTSERIRRALLDLLPIPAYVRDPRAGKVEANQAFQKLVGPLENFDWSTLQSSGLLIKQGSIDPTGQFKHTSVESGPYSVVLGAFMGTSDNLGALEEVGHLITVVDSLKETVKVLNSLSEILGIHSAWAYTLLDSQGQPSLKVLGSVAKTRPLSRAELRQSLEELEANNGSRAIVRKGESSYVIVPVHVSSRIGAALLLHSEKDVEWMERGHLAIDLVVLALQRDLAVNLKGVL